MRFILQVLTYELIYKQLILFDLMYFGMNICKDSSACAEHK